MDQSTRYYDILHLSVSASADEIRQAYVDLVRVWHPDRFASEARLQRLAEERLKEINEAYAALLSADSPVSDPPREGFRSPHAGLSRFASVFQTPGLGFWLSALIFGAIILAFLFAAKTLLDALAAPFQHAPFLEADRIANPLHFNPAAYGFDGSLPKGMERLVDRAGGERLPEVESRPGPNGRGSIGRSVPSDENSVLAPGSGGMGEFRLHNESDLDCVIRVFSRNTTESGPRIVYVRARDDAPLQGVKPGIYRLHATFGRDWNRTAFVRPARDYWLGPFQFFETETATERTGLRYNVSLRLPGPTP